MLGRSIATGADMKTDTPRPILLKDYRPPNYLIDTVNLDVSLHPTRTRVRSRLKMRRQPGLSRQARRAAARRRDAGAGNRAARRPRSSARASTRRPTRNSSSPACPRAPSRSRSSPTAIRRPTRR